LIGALFAFNWLSLALSGRVHTYSLAILAAGIGVALSRWRLWELTSPARLRNGLLVAATAATLSLAAIHTVSAARNGIEPGSENLLPAPTGSGPNVLLIVIDTLRADHLSAYGYARSTSPNLDRLAREGVLFENAIAPASWSLPSHTSILSGRFPYEHKADEVHGGFDGRYPLISEHLQRLGYRTAAFSGNSMYFSPLVGLGKGFEHFDFHSGELTDRAGRTLYVQKFFSGLRKFGLSRYQPGRWQASDMVDAILPWIDNDRQRPFFAVVNFFDVHEPYNPPEPFRTRFATTDGATARSQSRSQQVFSDVDGYDGAISYLDEQISNLLDRLNTRSLLQNTLVVITSDHGQSFGEHRVYGHGKALYRNLIHVPLIIRWPNHVPSGIRVSKPVSTAAIPATIMEWVAGDGAEPAFVVPSLTRLWTDPAAAAPPHPLSELSKLAPVDVLWDPALFGAAQSLVTEKWHYLLHETFGAELYDWHADSNETNNLAQTAEGRLVVEELKSYLDGLIAKED
jgi:arylsulfatase A-like enzyme